MEQDNCRELIEKLRAENEGLRAFLDMDYATGLPVRRVLEDRLRPRIKVNGETPFAIGVVRLDDRFRRQPLESGLFGILAYSVGQRLQEHAPENVFQSWRTDEFLLLIEDEETLRDLPSFGVELREAVMAPLRLGGAGIRLGCNVGFSVYPEHGTSMLELLENAEIALGIVEQRIDTSVVYQPAMGLRRRRQFALEHSISDEIQHGLEGFSLVFQPITDTERRIRGAEALTRWNNSSFGPVSPEEFIPVAEQYGQIQMLGMWAAYTAATISHRWSRTDRNHPIISLNVSAVQLRDSDFAERFVELIETGGGDPARFRVELTESVIVEDPEGARTTLQALQDRGVHLLIDDFGTGFSSFSYLHQLPIVTIKIAKEFVDSIVESAHSRAIVRSIIHVAHGIGGTALAEGIETEGQYRILREEGCDFFQGFLLARPQTVVNLEHLVVDG